MGFAFYIKKREPIREIDLLNSGSVPGIEGADQLELHGFESKGLYEPFTGRVMISIKNFSSRGVLIVDEDDQYRVRINTLASKADYVLAVELVKNISKATKGNILPESEDEPLTFSEFEKNFDVEAWIQSEWEAAKSILAVEKVNEAARIPSVIRNVYIGSFVIGELKKQGFADNDSLLQGIIERIVKIQFLPEDVFIPSFIQLKANNEQGFEQAILFNAATRHLLPKADAVLLLGADIQRVPFQEMKKYALDRWERLDDEQFIVPQLSDSNYQELLDHFAHCPTLSNFFSGEDDNTEASSGIGHVGDKRQDIPETKPGQRRDYSQQPSSLTKGKKPWWKFW